MSLNIKCYGKGFVREPVMSLMQFLALSRTRKGFTNLYVLVFGFKGATNKSSISDSIIILCETNNNCGALILHKKTSRGS